MPVTICILLYTWRCRRPRRSPVAVWQAESAAVSAQCDRCRHSRCTPCPHRCQPCRAV